MSTLHRDAKRAAAIAAMATCLAAAPSGCDEPRPLPEGVERVRLSLDRPNGLSGLTTDGDGRLWAVAESDRFVVRIDGARTEVIPLDGIPDGLDTESIAWIAADRFALGTESMDEARDGDLVLIVRIGRERARVIDRVRLPYAALGVSAEENHGVEALCVAGGRYYAVLENVRGRGRSRRAPLAVYDVASESWSAHDIALSTETGKIAALTCRERGGAIEAHAIERHFGVMRILRLELPAAEASTTVIRPEVARVLDERLEGDPNLEGITYVGDGLALVVDNHHGRRTGHNEIVRVPLGP